MQPSVSVLPEGSPRVSRTGRRAPRRAASPSAPRTPLRNRRSFCAAGPRIGMNGAADAGFSVVRAGARRAAASRPRRRAASVGCGRPASLDESGPMPNERLRVVAATPIPDELVATVVAAEPRIDFVVDQSLLPPQRHPGDHAGDPAFHRTEEQQRRSRSSSTPRRCSTASRGSGRRELARTVEANPALEWVQLMPAGGGAQVRGAAPDRGGARPHPLHDHRRRARRAAGGVLRVRAARRVQEPAAAAGAPAAARLGRRPWICSGSTAAACWSSGSAASAGSTAQKLAGPRRARVGHHAGATWRSTASRR